MTKWEDREGEKDRWKEIDLKRGNERRKEKEVKKGVRNNWL